MKLMQLFLVLAISETVLSSDLQRPGLELGVLPNPPNEGPDCYISPNSRRLHLGDFPDSKDCKKFYTCKLGVQHPVPHLETCPEGLHFNMEECLCDYPVSSVCYNETMDPQHTTKMKCACRVIKGSNGQYQPDPADPKCNFKKPTCYGHDGKPYMKDMPDPNHCGRYISCIETTVDGPVPIPRNCANSGSSPALYYNMDTCACDHPGNNTVCYDPNNPEHESKRLNCACPLIPGPDGGGSLIPDKSDKRCDTDDGGEEPKDFSCIGREDGDYPNAKNCSNYFSCSGGKDPAYERSCPNDLKFDKNYLTCLYPHEAVCATP